MKPLSTLRTLSLQKYLLCLLLLLILRVMPAQGQATISTPMGMGSDCGGGGNNYKVMNYNTTTGVLSTINSCSPSLKDPATGATFQPQAGSTTFDPVTQQLYYIETTTGNNSVIWTWVPGTCPTGKLAPIYTFPNDFVVGLEFNTVTGIGYQIEFSTGSAPYSVYLRQITSFSPAVFGNSVQITFPAGTTINSTSSDYIITPVGKMYLVMDNQIFSLDYSTYSTGVLNAVSIGKLNFNPAYVVGLAYAGGKLIASVTDLNNNCYYKQIDVSSGAPVISNVTAPPGSSAGNTFSATDMATLITGIGAAKKVNSVTPLGGTQYQVQYDVKVRNFGNNDLVNVQVADDLTKVFGNVLVSASAAAVGSLPTGLAVNTAYNGSTNTNLFAAGGTMIASPPDSAIVRITAILNNPIMNYTYLNSAIASANGSLFNKFVTDSSNNSMALDPDPNRNAVPDDPGEGVPTPLIIGNWVILANGITDFNGEPNNLGNYLHWTLQNQTPGSTINIQESTNGSDFKTMAQIPQQEGSNAAYHWQDLHPDAPVNYYRVQVLTSAGELLYSGTVALSRKNNGADLLSASPNPFQQSVNLSLSLPGAEKISYRILDMTSRILQTAQLNGQQGTNNFTISNLGNLPKGTYILQVQAGNDRYTKKLVKFN